MTTPRDAAIAHAAICRDALTRGDGRPQYTGPSLRGANLRGADLYDANLRGVNLRGVDLSGANLRGADLYEADLRDAYLSGADLRGADLYEADLRDAYLSGADLRGVDLRDAYLSGADLRGVDLRDAYLSGADLRGVDLSDAYLSGADLSGADLRVADLGPGIPSIAGIDAAILAAIERPGCALNMAQWHACKTTHCRAGWAIHLAGDDGRALEVRVGPSVAGALVYAASGSHPVPDWHASDEDAIADMRARAEAAR